MKIFALVLLLFHLSALASDASENECVRALKDYATKKQAGQEMFKFGAIHYNGDHFIFQPPQIPYRVNLEENFIFTEMVSDMIPPVASQMRGASPEEIVAFGRREWMGRKDDLMFSHNFAVMRGPLNTLVENIDQLPQEIQNYVVRPLTRIIGPLYESYQKQGPERAELLPRIVRQDHEESRRFIRFMIGRHVKPTGHVQVLISENESQPLHVVEEWGDQVKDLVRGQPWEVVGELGRLHIIHPNEDVFDYHKSEIGLLTDDRNKLQTNRQVTHLLLQKMLAWVNSDAKLDRLLIQINLPVEKVMKMNDIPLHLGERRVLEKTWSNGRTVKEVVYAFDRQALLQLEDFMFRKLLKYWFEYVASHPIFDHNDIFPVKIYSNEVHALKRLGLYELINPGREFPLALPKESDAMGFYMGREQLQSALDHIKQKELSGKSYKSE